MKKIVLMALVVFAGMSTYAFAGQITNGQTAECNNANAITLEAPTVAAERKDKFEYTSNDRGAANLVIWKSANFTTVPLTMGGVNESHQTMIEEDHGKTGLPQIGSMGRNKVVLTKQPEFSRGDSIGDISGLVKITNTGSIPVTVTCN